MKMDQKQRLSSLACVAGLAACVSTTAVSAQSLLAAGETFQARQLSGVAGNVDGHYVDRIVPNAPGAILLFSMFGGDGGDAIAGGNGQCENTGGEGARAVWHSIIGPLPGQLNPGRTLRFIPGQAGETGTAIFGTGAPGGGGGGGSAVLYDVEWPDGFWTPLAVAGGGGGAYVRVVAGLCYAPNQSGKDASLTTCGTSSRGTSPGSGACGGEGGSTSSIAGGGGGGGRNEGGTHSDSSGKTGGWSGASTGGIGGGGAVDGGEYGGYGYGGGGGGYITAGGGGGGYSGGGGGQTAYAGGGGASYVNTTFVSGTHVLDIFRDGVNDGRIAYAFVGQLHDEAANAINITNFASFSGTTAGATASEIASPPCSSQPDVWYRYNNDTADDHIVTFTADTSNTRLSYYDFESVPPGFRCDMIKTTGPVKIAPGTSLIFRVTSFEAIFSIDVDVLDTGDADSDGVPNDVDICPGVDDATLDPAHDVDDDGIHDICDQACPYDVYPDGEHSMFDIQALAFVQNLEDIDFNNSGDFEFFDLAKVLEGCEQY